MDSKISTEDKNKLRIMKDIPFFKGFSDDELIVLLENSSWIKSEMDDTIVTEGGNDKAFYIILLGSVSVEKKHKDHWRRNLARLEAGQCFGEMSLITGDKRSATVIANEKTCLIKIDKITLNQEAGSFNFKSIQFKLYKKFSEILADRLKRLSEKSHSSKWA